MWYFSAAILGALWLFLSLLVDKWLECYPDYLQEQIQLAQQQIILQGDQPKFIRLSNETDYDPKACQSKIRDTDVRREKSYCYNRSYNDCTKNLKFWNGGLLRRRN